jgi:hypothetical protein
MIRIALVLAALALFAPAPDATAQETPRTGGVLKVATIGSWPSWAARATSRSARRSWTGSRPSSTRTSAA